MPGKIRYLLSEVLLKNWEAYSEKNGIKSTLVSKGFKSFDMFDMFLKTTRETLISQEDFDLYRYA